MKDTVEKIKQIFPAWDCAVQMNDKRAQEIIDLVTRTLTNTVLEALEQIDEKQCSLAVWDLVCKAIEQLKQGD